MAVRNALLGGTDWAENDTLTRTDLNDTHNAAISIGSNLNPTKAPVGSVVAWLKSLTNTPALPAGWVECNGQTISDAQSPYNTVTIPDLNGPVDTGLKGRFLRGHSTSGVTEDSQNLDHTHVYPFGNSNTAGSNAAFVGSSGAWSNTGAVSLSRNTSSNGGTEARPHNYSVVWIMRIK